MSSKVKKGETACSHCYKSCWFVGWPSQFYKAKTNHAKLREI